MTYSSNHSCRSSGYIGQKLSSENDLGSHENEPLGETYFHMNGFARRLVCTETKGNSEMAYYSVRLVSVRQSSKLFGNDGNNSDALSGKVRIFRKTKKFHGEMQNGNNMSIFSFLSQKLILLNSRSVLDFNKKS